MNDATLAAEQQAILRESLLDERAALLRELGSLQEGQTRVQHARDVLLQDGDDGPQRDADREVDLARTDHLVRELSAVDAALARLDQGDFGRCADCDATIPIERLRANPSALRCVACEGLFEKRHGGAPGRLTM
jgi:DnaK suppressor protein